MWKFTSKTDVTCCSYNQWQLSACAHEPFSPKASKHTTMALICDTVKSPNLRKLHCLWIAGWLFLLDAEKLRNEHGSTLTNENSARIMTKVPNIYITFFPTFRFLFQFLSRARWRGSALEPRSRGRNRKPWLGGDYECRTPQSNRAAPSRWNVCTLIHHDAFTKLIFPYQQFSFSVCFLWLHQGS